MWAILRKKTAEQEPEKTTPVVSASILPRPRPAVTRGITEKVLIGCGNLYVTVNYDDEGICEVFANLGRAGGCPSQSEAASRLVSTALRAGVDVDVIIEQLKGIRCHSTLRQRATNKNINVLSCPDAIGRVLEKVAKLRREGEQTLLPVAADIVDQPVKAPGAMMASVPGIRDEQQEQMVLHHGAPCPDCGGEMEHEGGCVVCRSCGYSKCG